MDREQALTEYRTARSVYYEAMRKEDEAFLRYFTKLQAGERTNGAAVARLGNLANYASTDLAIAQGHLYKLDIDPWSIDDEDGVEHSPIGGSGYDG